MTKEIFHVVITRFSIRMHPDRGFRGRSKDWLFDEHRLTQKLSLFEHVSFSSISKGSEQPDLLLVLIDPELPKDIRRKLENIISPYSWANTLEVSPGALANMRSLGSLLGHLSIKSELILTTNLDDDDAIGAQYILNLKTLVKRHQIDRPRQPFHWFGSIDMQEWDLLPSNEAPLGFVKPYSGGVMFVLSVGFSVLTKNNPNAPSIFTLSHSRCLDFLTRKHRRANYDRKGRFKFRLSLALRSLKMGSWGAALGIIRGSDYATRLDAGGSGEFQGLIINHGDNLQSGRIKSGSNKRKPAKHNTMMANYNIDARKAIQPF